MTFRVTNKGSVAGPKRKLYKPGDIFVGDGIPIDSINELLRDKKIEKLADASAIMIDPTPRQAPVPTPELATPVTAPAPAPVKTPEGEVSSPWVFDPAKLKGKSLAVLNAMILERDKTKQPCRTVEEAIAQLSAEF